MMHLYFDAPAEVVGDARDALARASGCWLVNGARPAEVPGWSVTELSVGDQLLGVDNDRVVGLFAQLCETLAATRHGR